MQSEMRRPEMPDIGRYLDTVDRRLQAETRALRRAIPPLWFPVAARTLRALVKPLAQSGAMAITALAVILALSATPSARSLQPAQPATAPLAAPGEIARLGVDPALRAFLPPEEVVAAGSSALPSGPDD